MQVFQQICHDRRRRETGKNFALGRATDQGRAVILSQVGQNLSRGIQGAHPALARWIEGRHAERTIEHDNYLAAFRWRAGIGGLGEIGARKRQRQKRE